MSDLRDDGESRARPWPRGRIFELQQQRGCDVCRWPDDGAPTYQFADAEGAVVVSLCPRCMADAIAPLILAGALGKKESPPSL